MKAKFQIEQVLTVKEKVYVLAEHINPDINFTLTDSTSLATVPIENWIDIPRAVDSQGNLRNNYYAFVLKNSQDKNKVSVGETMDMNNGNL